MRLLVTGGGGQLAEATRRLLDRAEPGAVESAILPVDEMDITCPSSIVAAIDRFRPDVLLNAAAYTAVDAAETDEVPAFTVNAEGPGLLAAACLEHGIRMVQVSTDFVFDGESDRPYRPDDPTGPLSVYGRSKLEGERRCIDVLGDRALVVRTAWVYASGHRNFVATMLRLMRERDEIGVVSDQVGTPPWAPTLADAILRLVSAGAGGIHHVTDSGTASWHEFAVAIEDIARARGLIDSPCRVVPIRTEDYPTPARRPAFSLLDKSSTIDLLGAPTPDWRSTLERCLAEWRDPTG